MKAGSGQTVPRTNHTPAQRTANLGREASASGGVEHNGDGVWVAVRESHAVVHSGQRQDAAQAEPAGPQRVAPAVQRGDLAVQGVTTKREREREERVKYAATIHPLTQLSVNPFIHHRQNKILKWLGSAS